MTLFFAAVFVLTVWHQWSLERLHARHNQTTATLIADHRDQIGTLLEAKDPDLEQLIALIDRLCQRVQAPEQAVIDHSFADQPLTMPAVIPMDDDEGFRETKEQLAERLAEVPA